MKEVRATYQSKAPLRKPESEERRSVGQVGGVREGSRGPAFPPEPCTKSLSLLPMLMRHFPLHCLPTAAEMSLFGIFSACRTHLCSEAQLAVTVPLAANAGSKDAAQQPGLPASPGVFLLC